MPSRIYLILRSARRARLEGRRAPLQRLCVSFGGGAAHRALSVAAPIHQLVPAIGLHELGPAAVEIARRLLAGAHIGDVDDVAGDAQPLPFEIVDRGADPLLVGIGMPPRDRAAAGAM